MPPRRINLDKGVPKAHRMVACNRFHYAFRVRHRPKRRAIYVLLFCSFQIRPFESGQNKLAEHTSDVVAFFFCFRQRKTAAYSLMHLALIEEARAHEECSWGEMECLFVQIGTSDRHDGNPVGFLVPNMWLLHNEETAVRIFGHLYACRLPWRLMCRSVSLHRWDVRVVIWECWQLSAVIVVYKNSIAMHTNPGTFILGVSYQQHYERSGKMSTVINPTRHQTTT